MKNKNLKIINLVGIITILIVMLTGCGNNEVKTYDKEAQINTNLSNLSGENQSSNENTEDVNNASDNKQNTIDSSKNDTIQENTKDSNETNNTQQNTTKDTKTKGSVDSVKFQLGHIEGNIYGMLHAYDKDGNEVWKYTTQNYLEAQYENVEYLDRSKAENRVYINENGTIIVLDKQTGKIIWKNSDFGGSGSVYIFDTNDNLYIAGSDGPDLCVIDKNGKTIKKIQSFNSEYIWPNKMEFDRDTGDLIIEFEGGGPETDDGYDAGGIARVNLNDYTYNITAKK